MAFLNFVRNASKFLYFASLRQDHETWVRKVLYGPYIKPVADVTTDELVEMMRRVMECECAEHEVDFWLFMLEVNVPNERLVDLVFHPMCISPIPNFLKSYHLSRQFIWQ